MILLWWTFVSPFLMIAVFIGSLVTSVQYSNVSYYNYTVCTYITVTVFAVQKWSWTLSWMGTVFFGHCCWSFWSHYWSFLSSGWYGRKKRGMELHSGLITFLNTAMQHRMTLKISLPVRRIDFLATISDIIGSLTKLPKCKIIHGQDFFFDFVITLQWGGLSNLYTITID